MRLRPSSREVSAERHPAVTRVGRYLALMLATNLVWEVFQLPFYTLWATGTPFEIAWAVIHCTAGDGLIAAGALAFGWLITGRPPFDTPVPASLIVSAVVAGLSFTLFSEWRNTQVTHAWTYSGLMPLIPGIGIGLTPVLEWVMLPTGALLWIFRR